MLLAIEESSKSRVCYETKSILTFENWPFFPKFVITEAFWLISIVGFSKFLYSDDVKNLNIKRSGCKKKQIIFLLSFFIKVFCVMLQGQQQI